MMAFGVGKYLELLKELHSAHLLSLHHTLLLDLQLDIRLAFRLGYWLALHKGHC